MTESKVFRVAAYQAQSRPCTFEERLADLNVIAGKANGLGVDVLTFPECFLTGYFPDEASARQSSIATDGSKFAQICRSTSGLSVTVIAGFTEQYEGRLYNSSAVIEGGKCRGIYFQDDLAGKVIAVWGLAFKPGTDDVRDTPSLTLIKALLEAGATVKAHDPEAQETFKALLGPHASLHYAKESYDAAMGADALVLVTEWAEYKRPDFPRLALVMKSKAVFDFRNQYSFHELKSLGFYYECIGRPDSRRP